MNFLIGASSLNSILLYAEQFDADSMRVLFDTAHHIEARSGDRSFRESLRKLLTDRSCALYFPQCSTRTFVSFSLAAQALGMMVEEIRDTNLSAEYKGESELDTLLTLAALSDTIIVREQSGAVAERMAYEILHRQLQTKLVNGGSGSDQHPTQALLDLYTLDSRLGLQSIGTIRTIALVGDLKRSRTARSLSRLLALYPQVRQIFVSPKELQMGNDVLKYLASKSIDYSLTAELDDVLPEVDAIYMMRIQDEYSFTSDEIRQRYASYHLTASRAKALNPSAIVIHPLPRRDEIPLEFDDDPRAQYWKAVSLGKVVRISLLAFMHGADKDLRAL